MKELIILNNWEKAKLAVAECKTIDEVKKIRDKAEALRAYAKQAKEGLVVQNNVCEIKLRCERKMGEMLPKTITIGTKSHDTTLSDLGISKDQSVKYQSIFSLPNEEFERHIADVKASNEELTTMGIIRLAKKLEPKPETPALPEGKYQVIYADPPWMYGQEQHSKEKQATVLETHYPSMPTEDICQLPIGNLGLDNSVLFLWTTSPKLFECKSVIDAWGYDYKSSMIWDKVKHNVGYYVSVRHEFLLICTRGSCLPDNPKLYDSVITEERTEHSKKPKVFYEIIEDIYKGKKIELFARNKRQGWDCWGNQI